MGIHVKWSSGDQIWYDGTQDILRIKDNAEGVEIGEDAAGIDFKIYGANTGDYMLYDVSTSGFNMGGTAAADYSGAVSAITVIGGIVTAAS